MGKRLELLTEVIPGIGRLGVLWDASSEGSKISFKEYQAAAVALKLQLQSLESARPEAGPGPGSFQSAVKGRAGTSVTIGGGVLNRHREKIVHHAIKHRLPSMYDSSLWIQPGGLTSYSSNDAESYRRAASHVYRIHKGNQAC